MSAYAPGYENDIFVSYAWVDNKPLPGIKKGWVSCLVEVLENYLSLEVGRSDQVKVWMDKRNNDRVHLTSELLGKVKHSATLLMVLSRGYLTSKWCKAELNCFLERFNAGSNESLRQIFVAEKTIHRVKRPKALEEVISYPFWYSDGNNRIRTWGLHRYPPEETEYYHQVQNIAYDVTEELERLKGETHAECSA